MKNIETYQEQKYAIYTENECIAFNMYEDELIKKINIKMQNPNLNIKPKKLILIDVNSPEIEGYDKNKKNIIYNPFLQIKNDNEINDIVNILLNNMYTTTTLDEYQNTIIQSDNVYYAGISLLLKSMILFLYKYRNINERNFDTLLYLIKANYLYSKELKINAYENMLNTITIKNDKSKEFYLCFKNLTKEIQNNIFVILYDYISKFTLYKDFNRNICLKVSIDFNIEYPCYMLYLDNINNSIQEKVFAEMFLLQKNNILIN